jgi:hypothetical protein
MKQMQLELNNKEHKTTTTDEKENKDNLETEEEEEEEEAAMPTQQYSNLVELIHSVKVKLIFSTFLFIYF